jgi:hypothetical protein
MSKNSKLTRKETKIEAPAIDMLSIALRGQEASVQEVTKPTPIAESTKKSTPAKSKKISAEHDDIFGEASAPTRRGTDATIYFSNEVLEVVDQIADQRKISRSKVVDIALRQVLKIK